MNPWLLGVLALTVGALAPAVWISSRGGPVDRLVGLELATVAGALILMGFSQAVRQPSYLIVPLVLVLVGFAGTLVFVRLLGPRA